MGPRVASAGRRGTFLAFFFVSALYLRKDFQNLRISRLIRVPPTVTAMDWATGTKSLQVPLTFTCLIDAFMGLTEVCVCVTSWLCFVRAFCFHGKRN